MQNLTLVLVIVLALAMIGYWAYDSLSRSRNDNKRHRKLLKQNKKLLQVCEILVAELPAGSVKKTEAQKLIDELKAGK
jgi:hypothetical protein